jgi:hypothetical protein
MLDPRHVHSMGMSAGAADDAFSFARAAYVASVSTYPAADWRRHANPANKFAALIHGGAVTASSGRLQGASESYYSTLSDDGHFAAICDHARGTMPRCSAQCRRLFATNPMAWPSPQSAGLPDRSLHTAFARIPAASIW